MLLAGNGPLNIQVALELARAGAEVLAVAELATKPGPGALPALGRMLTSTPALAWRGFARLRAQASRVAMLHGNVLRRDANRGRAAGGSEAGPPPMAPVPSGRRRGHGLRFPAL